MATRPDLDAVPRPVTPGPQMRALARFHRDVIWTGIIEEGGMGPGTPAMTATGWGKHEAIQDGRWIVGDYEQDQYLTDGTFVLKWQLHWVAGWDPASNEYRATIADNYGHADVMRGRIDGVSNLRDCRQSTGTAAPDLGHQRASRHNLAERDVRRRQSLVAGRGIPLSPHGQPSTPAQNR